LLGDTVIVFGVVLILTMFCLVAIVVYVVRAYNGFNVTGAIVTDIMILTILSLCASPAFAVGVDVFVVLVFIWHVSIMVIMCHPVLVDIVLLL
jgi:hypothetical protein